MRVQSLGREDPLEEEMATPPVFLPGKSHGPRSLAGYSPWGHKRGGYNLAIKQQQSLRWLALVKVSLEAGLVKENRELWMYFKIATFLLLFLL